MTRAGGLSAILTNLKVAISWLAPRTAAAYLCLDLTQQTFSCPRALVCPPLAHYDPLDITPARAAEPPYVLLPGQMLTFFYFF
jgi:hypothetical protein